MNAGKELKRLRLTKQLKQQDVAKAAGIDGGYLSEIERFGKVIRGSLFRHIKTCIEKLENPHRKTNPVDQKAIKYNKKHPIENYDDEQLDIIARFLINKTGLTVHQLASGLKARWKRETKNRNNEVFIYLLKQLKRACNE